MPAGVDESCNKRAAIPEDGLQQARIDAMGALADCEGHDGSGCGVDTMVAANGKFQFREVGRIDGVSGERNLYVVAGLQIRKNGACWSRLVAQALVGLRESMVWRVGKKNVYGGEEDV